MFRTLQESICRIHSFVGVPTNERKFIILPPQLSLPLCFRTFSSSAFVTLMPRAPVTSSSATFYITITRPVVLTGVFKAHLGNILINNVSLFSTHTPELQWKTQTETIITVVSSPHTCSFVSDVKDGRAVISPSLTLSTTPWR